MDKEKKKALRAQYDQRKPDMGIVCWQNGEKMWIAVSKDAKSDYNSSLFQLQLGIWPNREMQKAFTDNPDSFQWSLLKKLDYKERDEEHSDDLEFLYMMCMDAALGGSLDKDAFRKDEKWFIRKKYNTKYPDAQQMRPGKR